MTLPSYRVWLLAENSVPITSMIPLAPELSLTRFKALQSTVDEREKEIKDDRIRRGEIWTLRLSVLDFRTIRQELIRRGQMKHQFDSSWFEKMHEIAKRIARRFGMLYYYVETSYITFLGKANKTFWLNESDIHYFKALGAIAVAEAVRSFTATSLIVPFLYSIAKWPTYDQAFQAIILRMYEYERFGINRACLFPDEISTFEQKIKYLQSKGMKLDVRSYQGILGHSYRLTGERRGERAFNIIKVANDSTYLTDIKDGTFVPFPSDQRDENHLPEELTSPHTGRGGREHEKKEEEKEGKEKENDTVTH
jgi:hypothetical protein